MQNDASDTEEGAGDGNGNGREVDISNIDPIFQNSLEYFPYTKILHNACFLCTCYFDAWCDKV